MSRLASPIESPMKLSSNFILSIEANDLVGYNEGDNVPGIPDNSNTGNTFINGNNPNYGKFHIDSEGYKCVNFPVNGIQYQTTNLYLQSASVTYGGVIDVQFKAANISMFALLGGDALAFVPPAYLYIGIDASINYYLSNTLLPFGKSVILVRRTSNYYELWVNGKLTYSNSFTITLNTTPYRYYFGAGGGFTGNLYQMHVCTEYLDDSKMKKLTRYMAFKNGIKI